MIYLLRDDFDGSEELARLKSQFGDPSARELNTTVLDGRSFNVDDLIQSCEVPPFLADRRLVIVRRLLARFQSKNDREGKGQGASAKREQTPAKASLAEQLCAVLERVPEFTDLVFVEDAVITAGNPVYKVIQKAGGKIVQRARPLKGQELAEWVRQRVRKKDGKIAAAAAEELAAYAGEDLRALDSDLEKLLVYAAGREVTVDDVRALVSDSREANIFAFVDAVGEGNTRMALKVLHDLLYDGAAPGYLLTMITRQYRMLVQVSDLGPSSSPDDVASRLQMHRFVAQKVLQQARRFSMERLERAYRKLVATDLAMKTSALDPAAALDLLVMDLAGR